MTDFSDFDIISFLDDYDIKYWDKGRNVKKNNINITCPFCGDHDYSGNNHCGIDLDSKVFNCWICKAGKGKTIINLVMKLLNIPYYNSIEIIKKYSDPDQQNISNLKNRYNDIDKGSKIDPHSDLTPLNRFYKDILPKESTSDFPKIHLDYLKNRNFDPEVIILKFKLRACHNIGDWKFRIIAPIIYEKKTVSFLSRDVTNKSEVPYLPLSDDQSIIPYKNIIYNIDNIKSDSILIVEGITDCWRFGDNCGATMSYNFTDDQVYLLVSKDIKNYFIMFDSDEEAQERAEELILKLSPFADHIERIELKEGDPADMSQTDANALKKELKL